mgnify:FL=1
MIGLRDILLEDPVRGGLGKWFRQKWVDVSRKNKSGKHPECGASADSKSRAGGKRAYPKCVPASKASSMSKKDKESATRRKRAAYKGKGKPGKKPKMVSTENKLQEISRLVEKNVPTDASKWAYALSQARKKFDVYPSAYANAWAAKKYKELGGGWRKGKKEVKEGGCGCGCNENFKDGKVKGKSRPGRVKRSGASCKGSVTDLRAKAKKYGGEKGKMYHWCANMKSGRK